MAPPTRTPRIRWIDEGLRALGTGGPDAVKVEALAQSLGVTKGSFYGQFDNRGALLEALLAWWEQTMVDEVITSIEAAGGDARAKLRRLFDRGSTLDADLVKVELAVRDWSRRNRGVARRLRRVDNRRIEYMRSLFAEICTDEGDIEARCLLVFSLFVGSRFIAAEHEGRTRSDVIALALAKLVE